MTLYKLSNPKNKMLDLNLTKEEEEEEANRPRPRPRPFLPIPQGKKKKKRRRRKGDRDPFSLFPSFSLSSWPYRTTKYISAIDREIKWKKKDYKYGTHSTSCCWYMTHDIQLNSYKNTLISPDIWLWKVLVWIPSIKSCGIKSSLFILYTIKFLFYSNLSIYMCETPSWRLEPWLLAPTLHKHLYL